MPSYKVVIVRTYTAVCETIVKAKDEDEAVILALDQPNEFHDLRYEPGNDEVLYTSEVS